MKVEERRRLTDLFTRGEEITIGDGELSITVWVRKMTPTEQQTAYDKASARRASIMSMERADPHSDTYKTLMNQVWEMELDTLIIWAVSAELVKRRPILEARIAYEKGWAKDNYLSGLQQRFAEADFKKKMEEQPDDEEVVRVSSELARFEEEIEKEGNDLHDVIREEWLGKPEREVREFVLSEMIRMHADAAWLVEYQKCQIWLCTYETDRRTRYFRSRDEVDTLQEEVIDQLASTIERLNVGELEGKDSEQTQPSSSVAV